MGLPARARAARGHVPAHAAHRDGRAARARLARSRARSATTPTRRPSAACARAGPRSARGSPSEQRAGSAGSPSMSSKRGRVSASVAPKDSGHREPTSSRVRRPQRSAAREEEREEEQIREPELRRVRLTRDREREREGREQLPLVRDDVLRRPAPDRVRVHPRDDQRDEHDPAAVSKKPRNQNASSVTAPSLAKFASTSSRHVWSTAASTATPIPAGSQPAHRSAAAARSRRARTRPG